MTTQHHYINGKWIAGVGKTFHSFNPANGETIWSGAAATDEEVNDAVIAAHAAFESWAELSVEKRADYLRAFCDELTRRRDDLTTCLSKETGKPLWETATEVSGMIGKFDIAMEAYQERTGVKERSLDTNTMSIVRHKPHGVMVVLGPFNFPGHVPNGQTVPALLAGNTVVFKPSELTPLISQMTVECWEAAKLPPGVINLVQGERETAKTLVAHPTINGVLFVGSYATGCILHKLFSGQTDKMLALEMGGNNPLVIANVSDIKAAAYHTIQSAFITAGQRCTCARRLIIVNDKNTDDFLSELISMTKKIVVGPYDQKPEPFMGPVISTVAADRLLQAQETLQQQGGQSLLSMRLLKEGTSLLSPGVMDVTSIDDRVDEEYFGPFLQIIRCNDFDSAIREANNTAYGLSSGLLSDDRKLFEEFYRRIHAGLIHWNRSLTGSDGHTPFGGVGHSGNYRPSAFYSSDYCAYPVSSMQCEHMVLPEKVSPGLEL